MKKMTYLFILLALLTRCVPIGSEKTPTDIQLSEKSAKIIESNNLFGYQFFETILALEETPNKNIMVSPLSVSQALSMTLNGAKDNTLEQMQNVLGFPGLPLKDINESNYSIVNALLNHDSKVKLQIANSVWYRNDLSVEADFVNNNKTYYNAEVNNYNPNEPDKAKTAMNNWVDKNTNGKIEEIIDNISPMDVMFLINAVYFKSEWKTKFKKTATHDLPFTPDAAAEKKVATMTGEVELSYINEANYSAIKLPYGNGKFNMIIFLPEVGYSANDIAKEIHNTNFAALTNSKPVEREIWLPKFEFEYENKLNDELAYMGMTDAFSPTIANFENIADNELYISKVNHKTYIKTDEEGSEAAAATIVVIGFTSVGPSEIIKINRSFLFAITEDDTNSVLFIGKVHDPSLTK